MMCTPFMYVYIHIIYIEIYMCKYVCIYIYIYLHTLYMHTLYICTYNVYIYIHIYVNHWLWWFSHKFRWGSQCDPFSMVKQVSKSADGDRGIAFPKCIWNMIHRSISTIRYDSFDPILSMIGQLSQLDMIYVIIHYHRWLQIIYGLKACGGCLCERRGRTIRGWVFPPGDRAPSLCWTHQRGLLHLGHAAI